jgi:aspartate/methionine/tyrosine aminotransferase
LQPFYDMYPSSVTMAGGVPVYVPLRRRPRSADGGRLAVDASEAWTLDLDELRAAVTPRTRVLVLNTPHNPTGKVFSRAELAALAALAHEHDLVVFSDEVVRAPFPTFPSLMPHPAPEAELALLPPSMKGRVGVARRVLH